MEYRNEFPKKLLLYNLKLLATPKLSHIHNTVFGMEIKKLIATSWWKLTQCQITHRKVFSTQHQISDMSRTTQFTESIFSLGNIYENISFFLSRELKGEKYLIWVCMRIIMRTKYYLKLKRDVKNVFQNVKFYFTSKIWIRIRYLEIYWIRVKQWSSKLKFEKY